MKKIKLLLTLLSMILCLFIGSDAIAQQTDKQMPKITPVKAYETDNIRTSRKKPIAAPKPEEKSSATTTKGAKIVIHSENSNVQRKALELRLERLENSNLTSKQKTIMREKIQTRLNSLK